MSHLRILTAIIIEGVWGTRDGTRDGKGTSAGVQCTVMLFRFGFASCVRGSPSVSLACRRRGVFS